MTPIPQPLDACQHARTGASRLRSALARFDARLFAARLRRHLRRWSLAWLAAAAAVAAFDAHYAVGLNVTDSMPGRLFLIERGRMPERGQYVAFRWQGGGPYARGTIFVKALAGVPGDTVSRHGLLYRVNGMAVGVAKPAGRRGEPLQPGPVGTLPPDRFFVSAPHPDSLDSRYEMTGWIERCHISGRARAIL